MLRARDEPDFGSPDPVEAITLRRNESLFGHFFKYATSVTGASTRPLAVGDCTASMRHGIAAKL